MKKFLTIGGGTQDIFINYENFQSLVFKTSEEKNSFALLPEGMKIDVKNLYYTTGGGATNSAVSLKRLGFDVTSCFKIGKDNAGEFILKELKKDGISTDNVIISEKYDTAISFILPTLEHDYVALCYRGANKFLEEHELPFDILKSCEFVHITSLSGNSAVHLPDFAKAAKEHNLYVTTNPGTNQFIKHLDSILNALPYINILILNKFEAQKCLESILTVSKIIESQYQQKKPCPELLEHFMVHNKKTLTLHDFFNHILNLGPNIVVVTDGAQGVYVGTKDHILFHPSIKTKLVNTLGAGDAFGSCFVGSISMGLPPEKAVIYGIINSSSVITHFGAKEGLLTLDQLEKKYKEIGDKNLTKFLWK